MTRQVILDCPLVSLWHPLDSFINASNGHSPPLSLLLPITRRCKHTHTHHCLQYSSQYNMDSLLPLPPCPSSPDHSPNISQVVHCRVCTPHPLHAPLLVLHLAGYPARPTQGRMVLIDMLLHSAQIQCNLPRWSLSLTAILNGPRQGNLLFVQQCNLLLCFCT